MMDATKANELVQGLTAADVMQAYSGKPGCMCGCKGRYYVTPASREETSKQRGYPVPDKDVSEKHVNRILSLVKKQARRLVIEELGDDRFDVPEDAQYAYVEVSPIRCYAVYLTEAARERLCFPAAQ